MWMEKVTDSQGLFRGLGLHLEMGEKTSICTRLRRYEREGRRGDFRERSATTGGKPRSPIRDVPVEGRLFYRRRILAHSEGWAQGSPGGVRKRGPARGRPGGIQV